MQSSSEAKVLGLLDSLIRVRKLSIRDVERRLGLSLGTLRRVLLGKIELKYRHITDVLGVLGITERTFFKLVFENDDPDNLERVVATAQRLAAEPTKSVTLSTAELEALIESTIQRVGFPRPPENVLKPGGPARQGERGTTKKTTKKPTSGQTKMKRKDEER